jgi:hypothetical protein
VLHCVRGSNEKEKIAVSFDIQHRYVICGSVFEYRSEEINKTEKKLTAVNFETRHRIPEAVTSCAYHFPVRELRAKADEQHQNGKWVKFFKFLKAS